MNWNADSKGLALERGVNNVGAISPYAKEAIAERGINTVTPQERYPQSLMEKDFQGANMVIALDESEHLPLMQERFPNHADSIIYWLVHDIDKTKPEVALKEIEKKVFGLIEDLVINI